MGFHLKKKNIGNLKDGRLKEAEIIKYIFLV